MNKKLQKKDIETVAKFSTYLASLSVVCIFSYVLMLGLTAVNVVSLRSTTKSVEDKKTELSQIELSYMTISNAMALEPDNEYSPAKNISYVNTGPSYFDSVAIANNTKNTQ